MINSIKFNKFVLRPIKTPQITVIILCIIYVMVQFNSMTVTPNFIP